MTDRAITIERDVEIPMRDGVVLRADLWQPAGEGPHPAILFRTAYNKALLNTDVLRPANCVDRGYAAVVQDTRGRFASEGDWQAIMWEQEGRDTYDTVEWAAAQAWCDGNVGMAGPSYLGIVQWLGAAEQPPHLRAIAPTMTTSAQHDAAATGGAIRLDHLVTWLVFMAADWLGKQLAAGEEVDPTTVATIAHYAIHPAEATRVLPLTELLDLPGFPLSMADILDGGIENAPQLDLDRVQVPTLSVGGWFDVFCHATVALHQGMASRDPGNPGRHCLIMGPWAHAGLLPHTQGELNFGLTAAAHYAQVPQHHLDFFDVHLRGRDLPLNRVRYFLAGAGEWRSAPEWPPPGSTETSWYLSSGGHANTSAGDGTLVPAAVDAGQPVDRYTYDPADPVPSHGGRVLFLGDLVGGPLAQNHVEQRPDVCCYTSAALESTVDAIGPVSVLLYAATSAPDTDFVAKLVDVFPDGRAILVADGIVRVRFRKGPEEHLVAPDAVEDYAVDLGHVAWRFPAGHRIRIDIASSSFPQFDRSMNTGAPVGTDRAGVVAHQQIYHSALYPSRLTLTTPGPDAAAGSAGADAGGEE